MKKYSFLKGAIKSLRPALLGGGAAAVTTSAASEAGTVSIPTSAIATVAVWGINMLINWLKNR